MSLLAVVACGPPIAHAEDERELSTLPAKLRDALRATGVPASSYAIVVRPVSGMGAQITLNDAAAMIPASTMKLVTTYAALELLGPAWRWKTEAFAAGPLREDVLEGDLVIRGGGDPKLVVEYLWSFVQRIRAYGVRDIRGDVVLDRSTFGEDPHDPGLFDNEPLRPYNTGPDALLLNFKTMSLTFVPEPDGARARVVVMPPLAGVDWPDRVPMVDGPCTHWREQLQADFTDPSAPVFRGAYPRACAERTWHVSLLNHLDYFGAVFRALWEQSGGVIAGRVRDGTVPPGARALATQPSPPLAEVIRDINKFSNNVMARQLFLTLGASTATAGADAPLTAERSLRTLRAWVEARKLGMPELVVENGSGLSRKERISARSLAKLLAVAYQGPFMPEFMASLPLAGIDGTMTNRRQAAAAHIKGGMLDGVRAIAGYVRANSGRRYVVVVIVNHVRAAAADTFQEALIDWIARQ